MFNVGILQAVTPCQQLLPEGQWSEPMLLLKTKQSARKTFPFIP